MDDSDCNGQLPVQPLGEPTSQGELNSDAMVVDAGALGAQALAGRVRRAAQGRLGPGPQARRRGLPRGQAGLRHRVQPGRHRGPRGARGAPVPGDRPRQPRRSFLPPGARGPRRQEDLHLEAAQHGAGRALEPGAVHDARAAGDLEARAEARRRPAHHARGTLPAQDEPGRAAAVHQRAHGRPVRDRPQVRDPRGDLDTVNEKLPIYTNETYPIAPTPVGQRRQPTLPGFGYFYVWTAY